MNLRLLVLLALVSVLSSCNSRVDKNLGVKFIDDAKLYSENFIQEIINGKYQFPNGVPILIITVDTIPISEIGFFANNILENSSKWIEPKKERKNCVLLIISKEPKLLQIRFGENVLLEAYRYGLSAGNKYRTYQESFIAKDYEAGLNDVLRNLEIELPKALNISWIMKFEKPGAKIVFKEMSDLAIPSDGAFTHNIFKPYSRLISTLNIFSSPLFLVLINALLLIIIVKVGKFIIIRLFGTKRLKKPTAVLLVIWGIVSSIFLSIPFWGSIVFLGSMRIEDSLFAQYLQIPIFDFLGNSNWVYSTTHLWLSIIVGIVTFIRAVIDGYSTRMAINYLFSSNEGEFKENIERDREDASTDTDIIEQSLSRGFTFVIFTLFMPTMISLLVLATSLIKLPFSIQALLKWEKVEIKKQ